MAVIRNNLDWKVKDFRGMMFEEVESKFNSVWKQMEDFIPMGSHRGSEEILEDYKRLVKETLSNRPPTSDKEMELWVELSRLYEPDDDQLWTYTQNFMPALVEWKLYDLCGVHHITSKDKEIFMLVALVMISYKLQVKNYSQMANDLNLKIYKIANL
nr:hypothetical protein [Tanacetum cinerariifolium]